LMLSLEHVNGLYENVFAFIQFLNNLTEDCS
jgi:hypothetical protein